MFKAYGWLGQSLHFALCLWSFWLLVTAHRYECEGEWLFISVFALR